VIGQSIAPSEYVTTAVGYVRLHGRNYEHWFTADEPPAERYNYLYSIEEMRPWAKRIAHIAESAEVVFVVTNNHFEGKAVANALQLINILRGKVMAIPESLAEHYPQLGEISAPRTDRNDPSQSDLLFGSNPAEE
jgi:uncharacterized protein YecE (DUF72 family)